MAGWMQQLTQASHTLAATQTPKPACRLHTRAKLYLHGTKICQDGAQPPRNTHCVRGPTGREPPPIVVLPLATIQVPEQGALP